MRDTAVVRIIEGRLAWYPPGAGAEPLWLDESECREKLHATLARRRTNVCFAAPGADARLITLAVSPEEKKHIGKSLPFTLEEQIATDVEDAHFAYSPLQDNSYAVAVTAQHKMDEWQDLLTDFSDIQRWLPEPLLLPWQDGEWSLVLEDNMAIVRCGQCEGFSAERAMVGILLLSVLAEADEPDAVIVYGSDQEADTALLPAALQQRVQWRKGGLCAALLLTETDAIKLNLLQGQYAPRLPYQIWWRQWRAVAAVLGVAFLLQLIAGYAEYRSLAAQNLALRGAVEASYRSVIPRGAVVDAEKQLRRQLDVLGGTAQGSSFVGLMEQVGIALSGSPGASISTINYNDNGDEMRLNIVAADFEGVEKLRSRINEAGLEAVMESSSTQGDRVSARLRVKKRS